jgi:hypothetical protein
MQTKFLQIDRHVHHELRTTEFAKRPRTRIGWGRARCLSLLASVLDHPINLHLVAGNLAVGFLGTLMYFGTAGYHCSTGEIALQQQD